MSTEPALKRARQILRTNSDQLLAKPKVVAVGVGYRDGSPSELVLVVMVKQKLPKSALAEDEIVPSDVDGLPVDVRMVGEVNAQVDTSNQGD